MNKLLKPNEKQCVYFTSDGEKISFKFEENIDENKVNDTWVVHRVLAYLGDQEVGYLKISYIPDNNWDRAYPDIFHYANKKGHCLGIKNGTIEEHFDYNDRKKERKKIDINSLEGKRELMYKSSSMLYFYNKDKLSQSDLLKLDEEKTKTIFKNFEKKFKNKFKKDFENDYNFHVNKPLVDFINVHTTSELFSDKDSNGKPVNKCYRRKKIATALYQVGAIWMGLNNMKLYRSSTQSELAKKINENNFKDIKSNIGFEKTNLSKSGKRFYFNMIHLAPKIKKSIKNKIN